MPSRRVGAGVAILALLSQFPLYGQGSSGMFVLRQGADTVSVERFTRSASRLEGELLVKQLGTRLRYDLTIGPDGLISRMENRYWQAADAPDALPRQSALFVFRDDSVIVDLPAGLGKTTQRFATKPGALPHINPSFALMELYLARAKTLGGARPEIPIFATAGAQTFTATVTRVGADSAVIAMVGSEVRLAVDANGSIRGGSIPAQHLVLEWSERSSAAALGAEKPDYSAPPGAPYSAEEVRVPTPMGHTLAGTLTLPRGASRQRPVPAIVTITGSGLEDRDEAIPLVKGYRPFRQFADSLGRRYAGCDGR